MQNQSGSRSQSAMEYLMTYGWAILIVAVVLGALFQLGVFSGSSLTPKAQPGSCKVLRPNGPGTTTFINLAGVCTGLLPQFVAQFNGASSYISTGTFGLPLSNNPRTILAWVWYGGSGGVIYSYGTANGQYGLFQLSVDGNGNFVRIDTSGHAYVSTLVVPQNAWSQVGFTYAPGGYNAWLNGQSAWGGGLNNLENTILPSVDPADIAKTSNGLSGYFKGSMANVQIYNASLSTAEIQGLYAEGIGGAPTRLQNLVGWWPLNVDANDYSGNGNNGVPTNVAYTSTWTR